MDIDLISNHLGRKSKNWLRIEESRRNLMDGIQHTIAKSGVANIQGRESSGLATKMQEIFQDEHNTYTPVGRSGILLLRGQGRHLVRRINKGERILDGLGRICTDSVQKVWQ